MKYITYESIEFGPVFVIFDKITNHDDMASRLPYEKILGAGFVGFGDDGEAYCYGKSVSLKIESRGQEDNEIIKKCSSVVATTYVTNSNTS